MIVRTVGTLLVAALLALSLAAADDVKQNGEPKDFPPAHNEWTVVQLEAAMAAGTLTSVELTKE